MSRDTQLHALARIARLKADIELERFSDLRRQMAALDGRMEDLRGEMVRAAEGAVRAWADTDPAATAWNVGAVQPDMACLPDGASGPTTTATAATATPIAPATGLATGSPAGAYPGSPDQRLNDTRLANALTRAAMIEAQEIAAERRRMTPRFDAARTEATRAFGRAEAVAALARNLAAARRAQTDRRTGG